MDVYQSMVLVALVFVVVIMKLNERRRNALINDVNLNLHLPPGGRGWAIIGDGFNWYRAVASSHPSRFVEQQQLRYGKIFTCNLVGKRAVVSTDPEFNRFVMQNEGKLFQSSYPKSFKDLVGENGVINAQGDQQKKLHSIASNMMRFDKLKPHFLNGVQKVMHQTLSNLHHNQVISLQDTCRKASKSYLRDWIRSSYHGTVNWTVAFPLTCKITDSVTTHLTPLNLNQDPLKFHSQVAIHLMVNQILGVSNESEINEMAQLFSDFVDGCLSVPINFPGFAYHAAMKARETIKMKINKIVEMHKRKEESSVESGKNGVLWRLLEEENLADESIADFIINLLFAGNETTAKTMLFSVYFLTHCPKALNQILEEQERLKKSRSSNGDESMLSWRDYKDMPFTQCVIDETLRLAGIAIWLMREAKENVPYQDYIIPKGCFVVPFLSAVHLNETIYEEPLIFNPWRWMAPENQEKRNWRSSPFFTPFGGGSRFCPGAELARLQIAFFLHYFIISFRWNQLKEDRMCFFPSARLVNGFQIQLKKNDSQ